MVYDIFRSDMLVFACAEGDEQMVKWCLDNGQIEMLQWTMIIIS